MREALLFDLHSSLHRWYHSPGYQLASPDGEPTKATYGMLKELLRLVDARKPHYLAFAADTPREKLWRRALSPRYKSKRGPRDFRLTLQVRRTKELLGVLGVPVLEVPTQEADDILATLVTDLPDETYAVVVSRDKDLLQLVSRDVAVLRDDRLWTSEDVLRRYGVPASRMLDYQTLVGDSTDDVAGVKGVGESSARDLVHAFSDIRSMRTGAGTEGPRSKIAAAYANGSLQLSRKLVRLESSIEGLPSFSDLRFRGFDWKRAQPLLDQLAINLRGKGKDGKAR